MSPTTRKCPLLAGLALLTALATSGLGQAPAQKKVEPGKRRYSDEFIGYYGYADVVIATVVAVRDRAASNGYPPRVKLRIEKVLRGDPRLDRRRSVWLAPMGPLCGNDRNAFPWLVGALPGPKVGSRWILWGGRQTQALRHRTHARFARRPRAKGLFAVRADPRLPDSAENEQKTLALLDEAARGVRQYKAEQAAKKQQVREAKARWRARVSAKDLARLVAEADFVGVGQLVSGSSLFHITTAFKGKAQTQYADGTGYLRDLTASKKVVELLDRKTAYLFFLKVTRSPSRPDWPDYQPIPGSDGIVIADPAALTAVRAALAPREPR